MILTADQIKDYILNPKNKEIIDYQKDLKEKHELHITGLGLDKFINTVDGIENESYKEVKKKLAGPITVKAYEKALRPKDKIVTAKGGTTIYEFDKDDDKKKEQLLKNALSDLKYKGHSLKSYTETIWLDYGIWVDPMGISLVGNVFKDVEVFFNNRLTTVKENTYELKIDYISIYERINGTIFVNYHDIDYSAFNRIEYLILNEGTYIESEKEYKMFRVIDDEKDEIWLQDEDDTDKIELKLLSTIMHGFGKVPAVFNSNRVDKKSINRWYTTYCSESLVIAKDILNDYIDGRIYKKKLGIPRFWQFKIQCKTCQGHREIENEKDGEGKYYTGKRYRKCPSCSGDGTDKERNLTDLTELEILQNESQTNVPPFGSVTLPTEIQELYNKEQSDNEFDLSEVIWGQGSAVDKERKNTTAFEISVRNEGKIDKLRVIEENRVLWATSIINLFGSYMFEDYKGVIITPSTQFIMLTPTEARQVYLESKKGKSSEEQLTKLWLDYLNAEYENDPMSLARHEIIMMLTPMFHFDLIEAFEYLTQEERLIKKNLEEYIFRYETEKKESILIVKKDPSKLKEIQDTLLEYAKEELIARGIDSGNIEGDDIDTPVDIEAEAKARLKGTVGGVQGLIQIKQGVADGIISYESGKVMIMEIYGYDEKITEGILDKNSIIKKTKNNDTSIQQNEGNKTDIQ